MRLVNITTINHILVPKHEILSVDEKEKLLESLGATEKQLPVIFIQDPAIAEMKPKSGDVVKISRDSPTAGVSTYYRIVAE